MEPRQEEAVYDFLDNVTEPFKLEQIASYAQVPGARRNSRLAIEIAALLDSRKIAFRLNDRQWLSRRGFFEPAVFAITPTKLELVNGILIPGHRCLPFANPVLPPHEYSFFWESEDQPVPYTTTEGPPEDFYPFYFIFGEEYIPQYIGRDNPENESFFLENPYDEPSDVSIRTLDMRGIYRERGFVPGDSFAVRTLNWKEGRFSLEKINKAGWRQEDLDEWLQTAEKGFNDSFVQLGPGSSTEEQIAYAYWYGGERLREFPAYSLEEFLFTKTGKIGTAAYGIETRFWFADREIPDSEGIIGFAAPYDKTIIEDILIEKNIPVSEFVIHAFVLDALFRGKTDVDDIMRRLVPPVIPLKKAEFGLLASYIADSVEDIQKDYSVFLDNHTGPVRGRLAELHTAVIELAAKLQKEAVDPAQLPTHVFIVLSQIQGYVASLLEDLALDDAPPESELEAIDNSLDAMLETYSEVKELLDASLNNFRRSNLKMIHGHKKTAAQSWKLVQISINGLSVWRQALVPEKRSLEDLHALIQAGMGWRGSFGYRFRREAQGGGDRYFHEKTPLAEALGQGESELVYEYGAKWSVRVVVMACSPEVSLPEDGRAMRFIAGEGAAPPEHVDGPLRFCALLQMLEKSGETERAAAELGGDFAAGFFDLEKCNRKISSV